MATKEVIDEISGAIIAITLVMTAVFVPVTFMTGPVGTFYRQFGITMATSIILSGVVALTLTPVLVAMILKPHPRDTLKSVSPWGALLHLWGPSGLLYSRPCTLFDRGVEKVTIGYAAFVRRIVTQRSLTLFVVGGFVVAIYIVNTSFRPALSRSKTRA